MKLYALAMAAVMVPSLVFAADGEKAQGSGPNPYVECGIGAALFPDTNWAAVTSNAIWDLGTTALSSAISSPEMCNSKKVATAKYIIETASALEKDVAAGEGEYIAGLAETMGCASSQGAIAANLRQEYSSVVADENYANGSAQERAGAMYNAVKAATIKADASCAVAL